MKAIYQIIFFTLCMTFFIAQEVTSQQTGGRREGFTVKVIVSDSITGERIIGAALQMKNLGIYAVSNMEGVATFNNVPRSETVIDISCLGYVSRLRELRVEGDLTISVRMKETSLQLNEVTVTAVNSAAGSATSSQIGRQAIEHLQATNLADLMQLLPGQLIQNSDITTAKQINFRNASTTTDANNAFGASIIVDGVPVSNNATMSDKIGNTTAGSGVDLRQIGTDNIESVEVIRGIPSAEYGDLTSGAVIVKTKAGKTPWEIRTKVNPTTINSSIGKGWALGEDKGFMNASFDYAQAWGDPRTKTRSFDRISGSLTYTNTFFKKVRTKTKLTLNSLVDWMGQDLDLIADGTFTSQKDFRIALSHDGKIPLDLPFARTLSYVVGFSTQERLSTTTTYYTGSGLIPIVNAMETGYYEVPFRNSSYLTSGGAVSAPQSLFFKLGNTFGFNINSFIHQFNMGMEYRYEVNNAQGFFNDNDQLPLRPNSDGRPRPYYDIPGLNQLSGYIEDNMSWKIGEMKFKLSAGLRYTHLQPGMEEQVWSLSPRINASVSAGKWLDIRAGFGQNAKTPGLIHLYPEKKYFDKLAADNTGAANPAERALWYHTYVYDVKRTNGLQNATNTKYELGFDLNLPKNRKISVIAFSDNTPNGFSSLGRQHLFTSAFYKMGEGMISNSGAKPTILWENPSRVDTVWTSTGEFGNYAYSLSRGVEFDANLGRIESWNTSFFFSGAWMETESKSTLPYIATPKNKNNTLYPEINTTPFKYIYPGGTNINVTRRFSTQLRGVFNIPALRMVMSTSIQMIWHSYSASLNQETRPVGYLLPDIATNGVIQLPISPEMYDDPEYRIAGLLLSDAIIKGTDNPPVSQPPIMLMTSRLTKDISNFAGFSFFVNNTFFHQPWQRSSVSTTLTERNQGTFNFGMELYFKL
jgi:outer membrane receptor protein involved in Fe transport